ncbi:ankyrin repeat-containing domain protein [Xylogone sp. PMI_703]|nr:ankyrin repeat-containing domain protein [Xylogone sp. PMI_703]
MEGDSAIHEANPPEQIPVGEADTAQSDEGVSSSYACSDDTPEEIILYAASCGDEELVKQLISEDLNLATRDSHGRTPLMLSARGGHEGVVKILLEHSANIDVDAQDDFGYTTLLRAIGAGHLSIVKLLLEKNAGIEIADSAGCTPLQDASYYGHWIL